MPDYPSGRTGSTSPVTATAAPSGQELLSSAFPPQSGSFAGSNLALASVIPLTDTTMDSQLPLAGATPGPTTASSQESVSSASPENATDTPTPSVQSALQCETVSPLYCVYVVKPGDNLGNIAAKFEIKGNGEVTPWEILVHSNKPDIIDEDAVLQIDQKLRIPRTSPSPTGSHSNASERNGAETGNAVIHTVLSAQTLIEIADLYGVDADAISAVVANGITDPDYLSIGTELIVPNPRRFTSPAAATEPLSTPSSGTGSSIEGNRDRTTSQRQVAGFIWPTSGPISSYFGPSHPLGIDIDLYSNPRSAIIAAAGGKVTFAGGNPCCSYGYYVVVDHGNGMSTLYAHLSKISVAAGDQVSAGEILGNGGSTGYSTGDHLHFEIHRNGSVLNPLEYLP